ncbi:hypothetical protein N752_28295 [Desulforamulus aquiferis]|nr:site-2 protease family protein [Desulforamulus aquiferis]RYD01759.1 hypothetical protein N752_28295 [Desulforamulus aquiferis]
MLAIFNLLPALPLDGGRIFRALLAGQVGMSQATYIAAKTGQVMAVLIACLGIIGVMIGFNGLDVVIISMFVFYSATREKA